jgi:hypothetical protein
MKLNPEENGLPTSLDCLDELSAEGQPRVQGGQMRLRKNGPKCSPTHFTSKLLHNFYLGKKQPKILGYFCNFKKSAQRKPPTDM